MASSRSISDVRQGFCRFCFQGRPFLFDMFYQMRTRLNSGKQSKLLFSQRNEYIRHNNKLIKLTISLTICSNFPAHELGFIEVLFIYFFLLGENCLHADFVVI